MKRFKQLMSSLLALWMVCSMLLPAGLAQEATEVTELWHEIQEANKDIYSMRIDGNLHMEATPVEGEKMLTDAQWSGEYNLDPFIGQMNTQFKLAGEELDLEKDVNAVLSQGILYYQIDGQQWAAMDVTSYANAIGEQIMYAQGQMDTSQELEDTFLKYMNYEETDTEHLFTLKENIDGGQLYDELDQAGFFEEVRKAALEQAEQQAEVEGLEQPTPQEMQEVIDQLYSREHFIKFFQSNPTYLIAYDKEMKQLTRLEIDMTLMVDDFVEEPNEASEISQEDKLHSVRIIMNLTFSHHGETFDITVPTGVEIAPEPVIEEEVAEPVEPTEVEEEEALQEDADEPIEEPMEEVEEEATE
ncbi:hypothetical protein [Dolosicoccus paucivorans]